MNIAECRVRPPQRRYWYESSPNVQAAPARYFSSDGSLPRNSAQSAIGHAASPCAVPSFFPGRQWQQVLARDASADGQFFYAVQSTGIYCRPSCPSRRPRARTSRFFPTAAAAEQAGFRACKRCEPDRATPRPDPQAAVIAAASEYLAQHADQRTRLADLAKATGVGRLTLLRGFRRVLGVSPGEFAKRPARRPLQRRPAPVRIRPKPAGRIPHR
jgi:methylphosphotriester-DNA--protein-cysteine methyltransferase